MVQKFVEKWTALEVSDSVVRLRQAVQDMVWSQWGLDLEESSSSAPQAKPIRALLHPYIMKARQGESVDMNLLREEIQKVIE